MQTIGGWPVMLGSTGRRGWGRGGICGRAGSIGGGCGSVICSTSVVCGWSAAGSARSWWMRRARWRLRQRSAPLVVLPSASLRARYCLVAGSWLARVTAMMCRAWLSWRSPPRLSRCCVRLPEEHGIGAVPDSSAKLGLGAEALYAGGVADQDRCGQRPAAELLQQLGALRGDELRQLAVQNVDLAVEAAQLGDLVARDPCPRAGRGACAAGGRRGPAHAACSARRASVSARARGTARVGASAAGSRCGSARRSDPGDDPPAGGSPSPARPGTPPGTAQPHP